MSESGGMELLVRLESSGALTPTGLRLSEPDLPYERYEAIGALLGVLHKTMQWAIGDWLIFGESVYGEEVYQASEVLGVSVDQRWQYLRVAYQVAPVNRRKELSWSHHRAVMNLTPAEQSRWLDRAVNHGWSKRELEEHISPSKPKAPDEAASVPTVHLAVEDAAREVCYHAMPYDPEDGGDTYYLVPADAVQSLARALGVEVEPVRLVESAEPEVAA